SENSLNVDIYNEKPFPFAFVKMDVVPVAKDQKTTFSFGLLPGNHVSFTMPLVCPYRGVYRVGMTELEVNDSFGLVKTHFNMLKLPYYRQTPLKIYPHLAEIAFFPAKQRDNKNFGDISQKYAEHGESYAGLRKYRPGDPLKRVHRAVSARRRELYVRVYDAPFETSVMVFLDTSVENASGEEGLYLADLACECAAAIAHYSLRAGFRVVFGCTRAKNAAQTLGSMSRFTGLYDTLAELEFDFSEGVGDYGDLAESLMKSPLSDMQAVYIISARSGSRLGGALAGIDTGNVKLISVKSKKSIDAAPAVWTVQIAPGDDVAAVLGKDAVL
ncbi:MAG: DUF58 domain-containing protein, partial [Oscillospiraceae bacterium]|nr:DUF58 domain-containing protein [Oscillospiraceae bacterium]